ncbi:putative protein isoform X1 [Capsicum annuum]
MPRRSLSNPLGYEFRFRGPDTYPHLSSHVINTTSPANFYFFFLPLKIVNISFLSCAILAMAGGGNFIHRVISYVANELIVNGLSNSASFQRFAVRTNRRMEDLSKLAQQKRQEIADQVKDVSKNFESFKNQ